MRTTGTSFLLTIVVGLVMGANTNALSADCDAVELMLYLHPTPSDIEHDRLVCEGLRELTSDRPRRAANLFREASKILFFDRPNYEILSRYALALYRSGERAAARRTLQIAALTLEVYLGINRCQETENDIVIVIPIRRTVEPEIREAAERVICGAAYDSYLGGPDLDRVNRAYDLVKLHYQIRAEIERQ